MVFGKGAPLRYVRKIDVGDGIAAVNRPCKLTNTSVFFCRCVDLDFMYWKLIFPPPRWHLFQHKGLRWWTKPPWWKSTFSLWLLLQMSIHVRDFFPYWKLQVFSSLFHKFCRLVRVVDKWDSEGCGIHFEVWVVIFEEAKWWQTLAWAKVSELSVCVCSCVVIVWESCVLYNWAVIAELIRSDCFFDQWAWCFPSWPSLHSLFFAWISIFSWWNQIENDARSQWEFWGK